MAIFGQHVFSPKGVLFSKSPPQFDSKGSKYLFELPYAKPSLSSWKADLIPANPMSPFHVIC